MKNLIVDCAGKEGFTSWGAAEKVVKAMRRHRTFEGKINVYRCSHCPNWHVGRMRGSK